MLLKTEHKAGIIAIIYGIVAFFVVWIFFGIDSATWTILGAATSMFSYGQLLTSSKSLKRSIMTINIFVRYGVILSVLVFAYFKTDQNFITLIFVLVGLLASKIGTIVQYLFFNKEKKIEKENEVNAS